MRKLSLFLSLLLLIPSLAFGAASSDFDGTNDHVDYNSALGAASATAYSCSSWVRLDHVNSDENIIGNFVTAQGVGFLLFMDDVDSISGRTNTYNFFSAEAPPSDTARVVSATNAAITTRFQSVSFSYEAASSTGGHLYIDFSEDANSPADFSSQAFIGNPTTNEFWSGEEPSSATRDLDGRLGPVQCWNRTLSQVEIFQSLWLPGTVPQSLQLFNPNWDGAGTHFDLSGNGANGTVSGNVSASSDGPPVMFGMGLPL